MNHPDVRIFVINLILIIYNIGNYINRLYVFNIQIRVYFTVIAIYKLMFLLTFFRA